MNKPYFSIVIPTYNRGNLIGRCIDSIISQTYTNWEAIIVDNYSEDNTEEIVMSYNDERIRFIKNHTPPRRCRQRWRVSPAMGGNAACRRHEHPPTWRARYVRAKCLL